MKQTHLILSRRYRAALLSYLKPGQQAGLAPARDLGRQALAAGLQALDLAKLHEHVLVTKVLSGRPTCRRGALIRKAGKFFAAAITTVDTTSCGALEDTVQLKKLIKTVSRRSAELAASNLELRLEIIQREAAEVALKKSERHYALLLNQSDRQQDHSRRLSRQILSAQEDERKKISRELHDVIAQTLTGINVRLAILKKDAALNIKGLDRNIARTQRLVEKSVMLVHRFARELRPAVLDDLGLIPALHTFMKESSAKSGAQIHLTASATVENLDIGKRTVLYRVAQEALTNVARHAKASHVDVTIRKTPEGVSMKIADDGESFQLEKVIHSRRHKHLGLLGMRERLEMVGGHFSIESAPGKGTVILAQIPVRQPRARSVPQSVEPRLETL